MIQSWTKFTENTSSQFLYFCCIILNTIIYIVPAFAIRDLAEDLEKCKQAQEMKAAELLVEVVARRKQVEIEDKEIARREAALVAEVKLPTEAEAYRVR